MKWAPLVGSSNLNKTSKLDAVEWIIEGRNHFPNGACDMAVTVADKLLRSCTYLKRKSMCMISNLLAQREANRLDFFYRPSILPYVQES